MKTAGMRATEKYSPTDQSWTAAAHTHILAGELGQPGEVWDRGTRPDSHPAALSISMLKPPARQAFRDDGIAKLLAKQQSTLKNHQPIPLWDKKGFCWP